MYFFLVDMIISPINPASTFHQKLENRSLKKVKIA